MKHVSLKVSDEIKHILPDTLKKDLQDNEIICPTCHGLGMVAVHNIYGIKGDTSELAKTSRFPYDKQSLSFCPDCFNGVVELCKYCNKPIVKGSIDKCDCEQYKEREKQEELKKYQELVIKAKEVQPEDVKTAFYDDTNDKYYFNIGDFINDYYYDNSNLDKIPSELWVCSETKISIDAESVIENACNNLHEEACEDCDYNSLQKILDKWCEKQKGTSTYYPCYDEYVKVKREWFGEEIK